MFTDKYTITVHAYRHNYHNLFEHIWLSFFKSVFVLNACCHTQCFMNIRFRGCLRPSLFIMGLLAGDYTCHLTLLLSFCPGTVVLRGGLRPPLFIMGLLVGDYICHLTLLVILCWHCSFKRLYKT